ncbi:LytR family transcriptional regulator [Herbidospora galbida]|uniref:LytR family transcriptional regulator n=1 Tax=Herbidospora galbida TaxID=2575442 RepID=A0A4V5UYL7_9ACTN|nr:LCP family protein [Herbidospora galbida]TKK85343.1 LytR family transcriptional regulator [Herbidospora galbida]
MRRGGAAGDESRQRRTRKRPQKSSEDFPGGVADETYEEQQTPAESSGPSEPPQTGSFAAIPKTAGPQPDPVPKNAGPQASVRPDTIVATGTPSGGVHVGGPPNSGRPQFTPPPAVQGPPAEQRIADDEVTRPGPPRKPAPLPPRGPAKGGPGGRAPQFGRPLTTGGVIAWTALSAIVPGAAHLRAGRRKMGYIFLGTFGVVLVAAVVFGIGILGNLGSAVRESTLTAVLTGSATLALAWFALILMSYISLTPDRLPQRGQIISGVVVGALCVGVMAPFAYAANFVNQTQSLLDNFPSDHDSTNPQAVPIKAEDPWAGKKRVNFLLIGGDAAGNRTGVRTDSMQVASVNVQTGNTVLFALPRNLQHVHFSKNSPLNRQFPNGFRAELPNGGLLNEVWQYAEDYPNLGVRGPAALKDAISTTLGLHIDYYAMVDMYGFAALVDAIGGLEINVQTDIKYGGVYGTAGTIKAGKRVLNGEQVLWYGRSRVGSDDFSRMGRQRCVIGALAQQASPDKVLLNFNKIVAAAKRLFRTDIPRPLLEHLVNLGVKVKDAKITSTQFVPPQIWPGSADWDKIKRMVATAIRKSNGAAAPVQAGVTASPSGANPVASAPDPSPTPTAAKPTLTPTPNSQATEDKSLAELCGF